MMLVPIVPADLEASYSKARLSTLLLLCSGLFATRDLLRVIKNAHGGWGEMGG
jgi:hypothetical protein